MMQTSCSQSGQRWILVLWHIGHLRIGTGRNCVSLGVGSGGGGGSVGGVAWFAISNEDDAIFRLLGDHRDVLLEPRGRDDGVLVPANAVAKVGGEHDVVVHVGEADVLDHLRHREALARERDGHLRTLLIGIDDRDGDGLRRDAS